MGHRNDAFFLVIYAHGLGADQEMLGDLVVPSVYRQFGDESVCIEGAATENHTLAFRYQYEVWGGIRTHLFLFGLLPSFWVHMTRYE